MKGLFTKLIAEEIAPARAEDCAKWIMETFTTEFILRNAGRTDVKRAIGQLYGIDVLRREYEKEHNLLS